MSIHFIAHRINTVNALNELPASLGAEIDLRDRGERLILQHDPFLDGEEAEPFFASYKHGTLILNIKSERIEWRVLELIQKYEVKTYFFLDSSVPMICELAKQGQRNLAVRFSEFETLETALAFAQMVEWVWVDCFTRLPLSARAFHELKGAGMKICLVSPELQGRPQDIAGYASVLVNQGTIPDAICTKLANIKVWQEQLKELGVAVE